ncbi:MAG: hypothetical protein ACYSWQ_28350, partial [Planctomycetota bacterium]
EGQIADLADRIAYNCHDLEDGQRARLIGAEQLKNVKIFAEAQKRIDAEAIDDLTIRRTRTAKAIINGMVSDCLAASKKALAQADPKTLDEVLARRENLVVLPAESDAELSELEEFLLQNFYRHETLIETADKVETWLGQLFAKFCREPGLMPGYFQHFIPDHGLQRAVCDYIAGMTDRFCLRTLGQV